MRQVVGATKPPWGLLDADELDVVGEVGAEEGVLAGAGGGDAGVGDVAGPLEGGVEARGGEGGVRVAVLEVVALDRVADRDRGQDEQRPAQRPRVPPPRHLRHALGRARDAVRAMARTHRDQRDARAQRWRRGQQGQAEDQGRGQVAQAGLEAAGHPVGAGGGGRGDQPGERGGEADQAGTTRSDRVSAARGRGRGARPASGERRTSSGQRIAEAVVEAGQEPVRPDRAVGQVAEDAVGFAAAERLLGRRQRRSGRGGEPRAAGCRCGRGCAGTSSRRRPAPPGRRSERPPAAAPRRDRSASPTTSTAAGQQEVELGPGGQPGRQPDDDQRTGRRARRVALARRRRSRRSAATATAASRKKIPTMSFRASPAWSASAGTLSAIAAERQRPGATRYGRPMHQQATRQPTNQPRFSSGESRSRPNASIPTAWKISEFAG